MFQHVTVDKATSRVMDCIRALSSFVVAGTHGVQVFILPYFGLWSFVHIVTSTLAFGAVLAFFVVSGFMIYASTRRHRLPDDTFDIAAFLRARVLRIYPPLIAAVALTAACYAIISGFELHGSQSYRLGGELFLSRERAEWNWADLSGTLLLLYGIFPEVSGPISMDGPLWTLSYEVWFYVLSAFAVNAVIHWRIAGGWLPLIVCVGIFARSSNLLVLSFLMVWGSGFLLGFLHERRTLSEPRAFVWCIIVGLSLCIALIMIQGEDMFHALLSLNTWRGKTILMIYGLLVAAAITLLISRTVGAADGQKMQRIASMAAFSYTLYIIHYPLLLLAYSILHPVTHAYNWIWTGLSMVLSLALIIAMSALIARVVENRTLVAGVIRQVRRFALQVASSTRWTNLEENQSKEP